MAVENQDHPDCQATVRQPHDISQLTRREIQAPIAACLIKEFAKTLGNEQAVEIAAKAIRADAMMAGETIAKKLGGNTMVALGMVVRKIWAEDEAITFQILEETDRTFCFNVTRCRYAEFYKKAEMLDLGFCLSCSRDEAFAKGFNSRMRLLRTQTIMQGDPVCDFRFVLEEPQTSE